MACNLEKIYIFEKKKHILISREITLLGTALFLFGFQNSKFGSGRTPTSGSRFSGFLKTQKFCAHFLVHIFGGFFYLHTVNIRRPVPSTDQGIPSCFYFRIS